MKEFMQDIIDVFEWIVAGCPTPIPIPIPKDGNNDVPSKNR